MLKKAALLFGVVLTLVGILGFVPAFTTTDANGMELLLNLFMVDATHNVIHLATGLAALLSVSNARWTRLFFQVFGVVYAVVTVVGFVQGDTVLGLIHVNLADNLLHLALAVSFLALGFGVKEDRDTVVAA